MVRLVDLSRKHLRRPVANFLLLNLEFWTKFQVEEVSSVVKISGFCSSNPYTAIYILLCKLKVEEKFQVRIKPHWFPLSG